MQKIVTQIKSYGVFCAVLSYKFVSLVVPAQNFVVVTISIEHILGSAGYTTGPIHTVEEARWEKNCPLN